VGKFVKNGKERGEVQKFEDNFIPAIIGFVVGPCFIYQHMRVFKEEPLIEKLSSS
jgi:hypothetical protein